jgi:signal transduction histidine kinase
MMEQVLMNLLLNSLQASERGTLVSLRLESRGATADLVVEDQGRGIPPSLLRDVFKPYVTSRAEGHGLGLAIVKRIVDQHGWTIAVRSVEGRGTRVTIAGIPVATSRRVGDEA